MTNKDPRFKSYDDIDDMMEDYFKTIAQVKNIRDIPLEDINDFMSGLDFISKQEKETPQWPN